MLIRVIECTLCSVLLHYKGGGNMSDQTPQFKLNFAGIKSDEDDMDFSGILTQDVKEQCEILNKALIQWDSDNSFGKHIDGSTSDAETISAR